MAQYELIQAKGGFKEVYLHGVGDSVSELIAFYYRRRQQFGTMIIWDEDTHHILATLGSEGVVSHKAAQ